MIGIGTFVLLLIAAFFLYRGRHVVAGVALCIALASTSGGSSAIASAKTVSTQLGVTGQSMWGAFIK